MIDINEPPRLRMRHQSVRRHSDGSYSVRDWRRKGDRDEPLSFEYPNVVDLLYNMTSHFVSTMDPGDPIEVIVPHISSPRRRREPTYSRTRAEADEADRVRKEKDIIISMAGAYQAIAQERADLARNLETARPFFSGA